MIRFWTFASGRCSFQNFSSLLANEWAPAITKKNKNTFAKMMRERKKKQKADEKRQRKLERKAAAENGTALDATNDETAEDGDDSVDPENPAPETESVEE